MMINLLHRLVRFRFHRLGFISEFLVSEFCRLHFFQRYNRNVSRNILFIHGLGTSSSTWMKVLPELLELGTVSCLDLPGYGFSKITTGDPFFNLQQMDHAVEHFIQITQRLPIVLIGHSLGGWLAMQRNIQIQCTILFLLTIPE